MAKYLDCAAIKIGQNEKIKGLWFNHANKDGQY